MPFPFLPGGIVLALAVLGGAFAVFGLALRAMDRAWLGARNTMAVGLVAGMRQWSTARREPEGHLSSSPASPDDGLERDEGPADEGPEEVDGPSDLALERVRRSR